MSNYLVYETLDVRFLRGGGCIHGEKPDTSRFPSFLLPGLGQIYVGNILFGIGLIVLT